MEGIREDPNYLLAAIKSTFTEVLPSEPVERPTGSAQDHTHPARGSRAGARQSRSTYVQWHPQLARGFALWSG
jgi:hypothetical protein